LIEVVVSVVIQRVTISFGVHLGKYQLLLFCCYPNALSTACRVGTVRVVPEQSLIFLFCFEHLIINNSHILLVIVFCTTLGTP